MARQDSDIETWEANGRVVLRKVSMDGKGLREVMVNKGRKIQLSAHERELNEERCVEESLNPFVNGTLSPVRLPEIDEDNESLRAIVENPNTLSESDMQELLTTHHATFDKRMRDVTSPYVVKKLRDMALESDDVTAKRLEAIEAKLAEVEPVSANVIHHTRVNPKTGEDMED